MPLDDVDKIIGQILLELYLHSSFSGKDELQDFLDAKYEKILKLDDKEAIRVKLQEKFIVLPESSVERMAVNYLQARFIEINTRPDSDSPCLEVSQGISRQLSFNIINGFSKEIGTGFKGCLRTAGVNILTESVDGSRISNLTRLFNEASSQDVPDRVKTIILAAIEEESLEADRYVDPDFKSLVKKIGKDLISILYDIVFDEFGKINASIVDALKSKSDLAAWVGENESKDNFKENLFFGFIQLTAQFTSSLAEHVQLNANKKFLLKLVSAQIGKITYQQAKQLKRQSDEDLFNYDQQDEAYKQAYYIWRKERVIVKIEKSLLLLTPASDCTPRTVRRAVLPFIVRNILLIDDFNTLLNLLDFFRREEQDFLRRPCRGSRYISQMEQGQGVVAVSQTWSRIEFAFKLKFISLRWSDSESYASLQKDIQDKLLALIKAPRLRIVKNLSTRTFRFWPAGEGDSEEEVGQAKQALMKKMQKLCLSIDLPDPSDSSSCRP
jgi:hypothetical protein